jgi:hypothetical protein
MSIATERDLYLIWSNEHNGWWAGMQGYTARISEARAFSRAQAMQICTKAIPGTAERIGALPELPVRQTDALALVERYRGLFPDRVEVWQ